tara:strand:+ start:486 stop:1010 length:525 start_codon:yes stop_codon:yes gene_type:complete
MKDKPRNHAHQQPLWVEAFRFTVPGTPHAKQRPRLGRGGHTFTPKPTKRYEESVAWHARAMAKTRVVAPTGVPVRVDILAQYPRPQRLDKAPPGLLPKYNSKYGDLDNHIKAILDGLNVSRIWHDDAQVQCIRAESVYAAKGQRPCSLIIVYIPQVEQQEDNAILEASAPSTDD